MRLKKKNDLGSYYANRGNNHKLDLRNFNNFRSNTSSIKLDLILSGLRRKSKEFNQVEYKRAVKSFLPVNYNKEDLVIANKLATRKLLEDRGN